MAKKDNFDFETEGKHKLSIDLSFFKNLTKQQKGIILAAIVAIVVVVAIVVTCIIIGTSKNNSDNNDNGGTNSGGEEPENNNNENNGEVPEEIIQFYISSTPAKTEYTVGDPENHAGLTVYLKSAEGASMYISYDNDPDAFTITGFDSSAPAEEQVITVECRGFTDTFTIKIIENDIAHATLVGITVDPLPQTTYKVGESFKHTGGYIVAEYSDGTFETIKLRMKHVSGYGAIANTPGEHEITISYSDDHGGYAETKITVTIVE